MRDEGVPTDVQSYNTLLFALARRGDWKAAWRELQSMPSRGLCPDVFSYNAVIKAASTGGHWSMARRLLTRMQEAGLSPTVRSYNLVLAAFKGGEGWRAAGEVLRQMRQAGLTPEEVSYNTLIDVTAGAGRLGEALEILGQMVGEGHVPSAYTYGPLLRAAVKGGKWETAASLVEGMDQMGVRLPGRGAELKLAVLLRLGRQKEAEAYHAELQGEAREAMVDALIYAGMGEEAVGHMERLLEEQREGRGAALVPVFTRAFAACRQVGGGEIGERLADVMRRHDVPADVACFAALVHLYTAEQRPQDALHVLQEMRGRGLGLTVPLYKSWLKLCRTQADGPATLAVLDDMRYASLLLTQSRHDLWF
jgi:pentatricopeptide repeat protein